MNTNYRLIQFLKRMPFLKKTIDFLTNLKYSVEYKIQVKRTPIITTDWVTFFWIKSRQCFQFAYWENLIAELSLLVHQYVHIWLHTIHECISPLHPSRSSFKKTWITLIKYVPTHIIAYPSLFSCLLCEELFTKHSRCHFFCFIRSVKTI